MSKELIQELRDMFEYHEDGYLIRKSTGKPCGKRANRHTGYAIVGVGKRRLCAHRIIFAIVYGEIPVGEVDHINGDRMDNRIENLRDVSSSENMHNSKKRKDNSSGFPGVTWYALCQKWRAQIMADKRQIHIGDFDDFEDAVQARKKAKIKYHPTSPEAIQYVKELSECGEV